MEKIFCVVGRDARQLAAAQALRREGYTVLGAEGAGRADYILLPMPLEAEAADLARILRAAALFCHPSRPAGIAWNKGRG